jgi:ATP-binding cassette, subfamily B, bacterial MsbA
MGSFKRILLYSRPYWWRIALAMVGTLCVASTDGAIAYLVEPVLKRIFSEKDKAIFAILPLGVIGIFVFRALCRYLYDYFIQTAGQLAIQDIRNDLYRNNLHLSLRFFSKNSTGALISRTLSDVAVMQEGVATIVTGLLREGLTAIGLLGIVFYRNWQLAIISFVVIPATVLPAQRIGKRIKRLSTQSQETIGVLAGTLQETFSGIKVIKAFSLETRETERFAKQNLDYYRFIRKTIKYAALSTPIVETVTSLGIAAVIWYGGSMVMGGKMTASEFFSFITAMIMLFNPVKKLIGTYNTVQRSVGAAERVFEIIDEKQDIADAPDAVGIQRFSGQVEFRNVSFRYDDEYVLRDISLSARQGEVVAFVGPSGAGKSTIVSLLLRFYDPTDGAVLFDGRDIRSVKLTSLLEQVALVDQETILFNDTIGNNIRYGRPGATSAQVEAAARAAYAHEFVMQMPEGYEATIGDRGVRLSGGQRQRICIARAILKDAPILVLDEATSALDTESEQMVQRAVDNLMANRTTFVIAHRLSTILHADRIIVLDSGRIVEQGTHAGLLEQGGLYKRLCEMQFKDA